MESRVKLLGHAVHPMLVMFPLGAFGFSVTSDLLHGWSGERRHAEAATLALDFGLAASLAAAPVGFIDWIAVKPRSRAKRVGLWHALGNGAVLGLFAASRWLRSSRRVPAAARWLSAGGFLLTGVTAWLGAELVERHGVGVPGKDAEDAPSSLAASQRATLPGDSRYTPVGPSDAAFDWAPEAHASSPPRGPTER
jgi:uncharacterized membrane protein